MKEGGVEVEKGGCSVSAGVDDGCVYLVQEGFLELWVASIHAPGQCVRTEIPSKDWMGR